MHHLFLMLICNTLQCVWILFAETFCPVFLTSFSRPFELWSLFYLALSFLFLTQGFQLEATSSEFSHLIDIDLSPALVAKIIFTQIMQIK